MSEDLESTCWLAGFPVVLLRCGFPFISSAVKKPMCSWYWGQWLRWKHRLWGSGNPTALDLGGFTCKLSLGRAGW